jgi:hypothetical protein
MTALRTSSFLFALALTATVAAPILTQAARIVG